MSHFFYLYNVSNRDGVDFTVLKWFEDGIYRNSKKIDKPTSELTPEELAVLQEFIDGGMVVQDKTKILLPDTDPGTSI